MVRRAGRHPEGHHRHADLERRLRRTDQQLPAHTGRPEGPLQPDRCGHRPLLRPERRDRRRRRAVRRGLLLGSDAAADRIHRQHTAGALQQDHQVPLAVHHRPRAVPAGRHRLLADPVRAARTVAGRRQDRSDADHHVHHTGRLLGRRLEPDRQANAGADRRRRLRHRPPADVRHPPGLHPGRQDLRHQRRQAQEGDQEGGRPGAARFLLHLQ